MPPLLADFIYNRVCELKCEKFLIQPAPQCRQPIVKNDTLMQVKIGSGKVAEPDFQRNGLPPELPNVQMRSGLIILSTPILRGTSSENFSATLPESSARRRHWGQGFPLQARFDIKTLCLRETPARKGGRFTAARGGG